MTVPCKNLGQKVDFLAKCHSNQDCRSVCAGTVSNGTSVTKNLHCAGARTVPALYGCGPHSNLIFKGNWTLKKDKFLEKI